MQRYVCETLPIYASKGQLLVLSHIVVIIKCFSNQIKSLLIITMPPYRVVNILCIYRLPIRQ